MFSNAVLMFSYTYCLLATYYYLQVLLKSTVGKLCSTSPQFQSLHKVSASVKLQTSTRTVFIRIALSIPQKLGKISSTSMSVILCCFCR